MKEVVGDFIGVKLWLKLFCGTKPIDGVWETSNVIIYRTCGTLVLYSGRVHIIFSINVLNSSILCETPSKIIRLASRILTSKIPQVTDKYSTRLEEIINKHRLIYRLKRVHEYKKVMKIINEGINNIDKEGKTYMTHAEKCRHLKIGKLLFSPVSTLWIKRGIT